MEKKNARDMFIELLTAITDGGGATLENGEPVEYASGYQVATDGIETTDAETAANWIDENGGTAGIWYQDGIYYIDKSQHETDRQTAEEIGRACKQISIYDWKAKKCIYL